MPVKEADPDAAQLEAAFAEAMGAPPKPREPAAPPEIDPAAPHGRGEDGEPLAPFGLTKEGVPRRSAAGRKPKDPDAAARTGPAQPAAAEPDPGAGTALEPRDFSASLMDAGESVWFGGSVLATAGPRIPLIGRLIPGQKLSATMAVFDSERPRLAMALNQAAQHDKRARRLAERLATGDVGWALTCMFMVAPFAGAVGAIWAGGDEALAERKLPSLAELAKSNEKAMDAMLEKINQQMQLAQQAAAEQAQLEMAAAQDGQVTGG